MLIVWLIVRIRFVPGSLVRVVLSVARASITVALISALLKHVRTMSAVLRRVVVVTAQSVFRVRFVSAAAVKRFLKIVQMAPMIIITD